MRRLIVKKYIKLTFLFIVFSLFIVACNGNDNADERVNEEENSNQETNEIEENEPTEEDMVTDEDGSEEASENEKSETDNGNSIGNHQEGLRINDTGSVVDNDENRYDVTLNSVTFKDSVADLEPNGETYVVANITVENTGDNSFDVANMYNPGFGPKGGIETTLNGVFMDAGVEVDEDLLEGEIAPGESVTGDHIFEIGETSDQYLFIIGGSGQQILTYANWDVLESDIEFLAD